MTKMRWLVAIAVLAAGAAWMMNREEVPAAPAGGEVREAHGEEAGEAEHGHEEQERAEATELAADAATAAGIQTETVGPAVVRETVTLSGRTMLNQNKTAQVRARFPGIVRDARRGPGDVVAAGDVLATVESNESLQVYAVKAPIAGVVLARTTNVGDVAGDEPMFTITDTSDVWAEFHVFPRDIDQVRVGQTVLIASFEGGHSAQAQISTLLPVAEASSQTVVARVALPNPEGLWRPGMTVRGDVVIAEREAPLAVRTTALQRMEGKGVVFVREGDRYESRPVKTGLSDNSWTEVQEGLRAGETYVTQGSFQVKADIGKAGAAHEH